MAKVKCVYSQS